MPCRSPYVLRRLAALVVLAASLPAPGVHAAAPAGAAARALVTAASPVAGRLLATAETDTPVVMNPFTVFVEASRQSIPLLENPAAVTVVGRRELASMPRGVAAEEALALVPGVRIDNQADGERVHIAIRGQGVLTESGIRGIKVLMDGLPLNDPTGVAPDLFDVDWSTVDHVEVQRGPAGAFYGGGGSGGVINIVTRDGGPAPAQGLASGEVGSYGFYKTLAEGGGTLGGANYRVSMSHAAANGWRQHTGFRSDNLSSKLRWTPNSRVDVQQVLAWTDHFEENAEGLNARQVRDDPRQPNADAIPKDEFYKVGRFTGGLTGRFGVAPGQWLRLTGHFRSTKYMEPRPGEIIRREFLSPGLTLQYDADAVAGSVTHHLSVGGDASWQSIDELRFANLGFAQQGGLQSNENVAQQAEGVFLMDRVGFARDWTLMLAGRYDAIANRVRDLLDPGTSYRKDFKRVTARAGLAWAPGTPFNPYANVSLGFLPPATAELANNPEGYSGINQALTFATSTGEELGARGVLPHALSYEVAAFHLDTRDDIGRFRLPPSTGRGGIDFYKNVGDTRRFGLETRLGWKPTRRLSADVAYTWSQFKYVAPEAIDGNWLPSSPEHMLNLAVDFEVVRQLSVGIESQMQSDWWVDTDGLASVPGFALWGAHASCRWDMGDTGCELSVMARNLFGAPYMAFTEPDFDDTGGIVVDVWNSYQPGPPQEYYARFTLSR
jgi:iron complex outermembrane receptor protein